MAEVIYANL